jgi:hypothetical protein
VWLCRSGRGLAPTTAIVRARFSSCIISVSSRVMCVIFVLSLPLDEFLRAPEISTVVATPSIIITGRRRTTRTLIEFIFKGRV